MSKQTTRSAISAQGWRSAMGASLMLGALAAPAWAADTIRVGYAAQSPSFIAPVDAAQEQGYFAKAGLDVVPTTFGGGPKLAAAMIAGASDIGLATGTDFSFLVKGAPEIAVGLLVDQPYSIGVSVIDPAIKTPDDLKSRKVGVTSTGSYTYWFASELPHFQHWPAGTAVTPVSVGGAISGQLAALTTGQIDAMVSDITLGLTLQQQKRGRLLMNCADVVRDVVTSVIFAHTDMVKQHPDQVRRFVAALMQGVQYLRTHRDYQIKLVTKETGLAPEIMGQYVDITNPGWSKTGRITPQQLAGTAPVLVQAGLLPTVPDLKPFYTEAFLPK